MTSSSSEYLIVNLPYYTNRLLLPSKNTSNIDAAGSDKGAVSTKQILEFDRTQYRAIIHKSLMERDLADRSLQSVPHTYVFPKAPTSKREAIINQYLDNLTDYPVVYIIYIEQDMLPAEMQANWLKECLDDTESDAFDIYGAKYIIYVGETIDIERRTAEHLVASNNMQLPNTDFSVDSDEPKGFSLRPRERQRVDKVVQQAEKVGIKVRQYVIWQKHFTKSLTLDIEDRLIDYLQASPNVFMLNGRGNPQGHYYESNQKEKIFSNVWEKLSRDKADLFPPEETIWNSGLYKVSPFHSLGTEQSKAVMEICDSAVEFTAEADFPLAIDSNLKGTPTKESRLILVSGASGTGKSIVLSRLFLDLSQQMHETETKDRNSLADIQPTERVCLVVNNPQQYKLYVDLAKKLGLQRTKKDECVFTATRFLNQITSGKHKKPDIVLVDEAHLLLTRPNQSYTRAHHGNQLYDILLNAKVVIAVIDTEQVMRRQQSLPPQLLQVLDDTAGGGEPGELSEGRLLTMKNSETAAEGTDTFRFYHVRLEEQFRIAASRRTISWIDRLADTAAAGIDPIPIDNVEDHEGKHGIDDYAYDIRVFTSPNLLFRAIESRATQLNKKAVGDKRPSSPLCRVVATYDWSYAPKAHEGNVRLYRVLKEDGTMTWSMPDDDNPPAGALPGEENIFDHPWNMATRGKDGKEVWSADPGTQNEIGSYFTIQGFDLNYVGVIIGPSVTYREGHIVFDGNALKDGDVAGNQADTFARQQFKILLRRGIHGLYLFAVDSRLQEALCNAARAAGKLDLSV